MTKAFKELRVRQLDESLALLQGLVQERPPRGGWVRAIREALGMSQRQLAERMEISKTTVNSAERNEARGTIQLDSLAALADGLDCELVYALVPRRSLQATLASRAEESARRLVNRVSSSMELEEQGVRDEEKQRQIEDLAAELLRERARSFWDD
ncbi:MAG: mobile mystery protein A [Gemmatimonadetes bacterium]|nr:mobile mystery protein A [Gemmatimonadota bacterium]